MEVLEVIDTPSGLTERSGDPAESSESLCNTMPPMSPAFHTRNEDPGSKMLARRSYSLPEKLSLRRPATNTAPPTDVENYPTIEFLEEKDPAESECEQFDYVFKIVLVGDSGVGKSNLMSRFVRNIFNENERSTIGVDMMIKHAKVHGQAGPVVVKMQLWDSAGQERFRAISSVFYRNAAAVVLVYDIADKKTFANIPNWLKEIRKYAEEATVLLLGNKTDVAHLRVVPRQAGYAFATEHDLLFYETSAFDKTNVLQAFVNMLKQTFIQFELRDRLVVHSAIAEEEEEVFDDDDDDNRSINGPDAEISPEKGDACPDNNGVVKAAKVVAEPLVKLKEMGTVVLEDIQESSEEQCRKIKRRAPRCC